MTDTKSHVRLKRVFFSLSLILFKKGKGRGKNEKDRKTICGERRNELCSSQCEDVCLFCLCVYFCFRGCVCVAYGVVCISLGRALVSNIWKSDVSVVVVLELRSPHGCRFEFRSCIYFEMNIFDTRICVCANISNWSGRSGLLRRPRNAWIDIGPPNVSMVKNDGAATTSFACAWNSL